MKLGSFTLQSCSDGKEMFKKALCRCKVVVLQSKPMSTCLPFSLPSPSSLLKLPNCREKGAGGRDKGSLIQTRPCREA